MLTYFCVRSALFSLNPYYFPRSPRFLKKRITQAVASLTAALAAAGTFVEARCFLRTYREAVPCIFFVMFGLFSLSVMFGLEPDIHGHKALAHDMHAESNAFQQRFTPQPVLRYTRFSKNLQFLY